MPDTEEMMKLAERLEQASGPDRELDVLIWAHSIGQEPEWQGHCLVVGTEGVVGWIDPGRHQRNFSTNRNATGPSAIPAYTSSLDAAMLLVPEGCAWSVSNVGPDDMPQACVTLRDDACTDIEGDAATPALALASASLRARANGGEA